MTKSVTIVGGGTAGWITAAYLARMLSTDLAGGVTIKLIESPDIGIIGVGEGTFPSIRKTLNRIGLDESRLFREANATFKQGVRFVNWRKDSDVYYHLFQPANKPRGLDLLPYWLLGAGGDKPWSAACNVQQRMVEAMLAPKLATHEDYAGPLAYAYHFDAVEFAAVLRRHAVGLGVVHLSDTVTQVRVSGDGAITSLLTHGHGVQTADLYIDCTGFRAQLIGEALKIPFTSRRDALFVDRAVAIQVPYERPDAPIASCTIATAQEAGWTWDIGLSSRRGLGYVYSSDHTSDDRAEALLRAHIGPAAATLNARVLKFEAGYRKVQWRKNCVAIGLSCGFIEPLEATGIGFAENAALVLAALFPWSGEMETSARQYNEIMAKRYENVIDFIKLHYCLTERRDTDFWRDNVEPASVSSGLRERLERWRYRMPDFLDVDYNHDTFIEGNWRQVLYGMGFFTDLSTRKGAYRYFDEARAEFAEIQRQADYGLTVMPSHRALIEQIQRGDLQRPQPNQNLEHA